MANKETRYSPIVIAEVAVLKLLGANLRIAAANNDQLQRAIGFCKALIENELEINRIYGRPLISKIRYE